MAVEDISRVYWSASAQPHFYHHAGLAAAACHRRQPAIISANTTARTGHYAVAGRHTTGAIPDSRMIYFAKRRLGAGRILMRQGRRRYRQLGNAAIIIFRTPRQAVTTPSMLINNVDDMTIFFQSLRHDVMRWHCRGQALSRESPPGDDGGTITGRFPFGSV